MRFASVSLPICKSLSRVGCLVTHALYAFCLNVHCACVIGSSWQRMHPWPLHAPMHAPYTHACPCKNRRPPVCWGGCWRSFQDGHCPLGDPAYGSNDWVFTSRLVSCMRMTVSWMHVSLTGQFGVSALFQFSHIRMCNRLNA